MRASSGLFVIGLTGQIGSGKSAAARFFAAQGCPVIDADDLARAAVEPGTPLLQEIVRQFGPQFLDASGRLRRRDLAALVFSDAPRRRRLEQLIHPAVHERLRTELQRLEQPGGKQSQPVVFAVPLLFEAACEFPEIDLTVVVSAPRELCLTRVAARDGCSLTEAGRRYDAQLPIEEKERRADLVIRNTGTLAELQEQVQTALAAIRKRLAEQHRP